MDADGGGNDEYGDEDDNDANVMWPSNQGNDQRQSRADEYYNSDGAADQNMNGQEQQEVMWPSAAASKNMQGVGR